MLQPLPKGCYKESVQHFLDAYWEMEKALQEGSLEYPDSMDGDRMKFSLGELMVEWMYHPLAIVNLQRSRWAVPRPRIDVEIYVTNRDNLAMEFRPTGYTGDVLGYGERRPNFLDLDYMGGRFERDPFRVLFVHLGKDFDFGMRRGMFRYQDPDTVEYMTKARNLCALLIEAKLYQLSLYFDCRVTSRVACFGPERILEIERYAYARYENTESYQADFCQMDLREDPRLANICSQYARGSDELKEFAREFLTDARLSRAEQQSMLAEYLGERQHGLISCNDVQALLDYALPGGRATKRLREISADKDALLEFCRENTAWLREMTDELGMSSVEVLSALLPAAPELVSLMTGRVEAEVLVSLWKDLCSKGESATKAMEEVEALMVKEASQVIELYRPHSGSDFRLMAFRAGWSLDEEAFKNWLTGRHPALAVRFGVKPTKNTKQGSRATRKSSAHSEKERP